MFDSIRQIRFHVEQGFDYFSIGHPSSVILKRTSVSTATIQADAYTSEHGRARLSSVFVERADPLRSRSAREDPRTCAAVAALVVRSRCRPGDFRSCCRCHYCESRRAGGCCSDRDASPSAGVCSTARTTSNIRYLNRRNCRWYHTRWIVSWCADGWTCVFYSYASCRRRRRRCSE